MLFQLEAHNMPHGKPQNISSETVWDTSGSPVFKPVVQNHDSKLSGNNTAQPAAAHARNRKSRQLHLLPTGVKPGTFWIHTGPKLLSSKCQQDSSAAVQQFIGIRT